MHTTKSLLILGAGLAACIMLHVTLSGTASKTLSTATRTTWTAEKAQQVSTVATNTSRRLQGVARAVEGFAGTFGPDKSAEGYTQCFGFSKDHPASWSSAMSACGNWRHVIFAGHRCEGTWVEFKMTLRETLSHYMYGGGRASPQKSIDTNGMFNMEWSSAWWVLTKGTWNSGPVGTARCWQPNMVGATGGHAGHILDQQCQGNKGQPPEQRSCGTDKYYVYIMMQATASTTTTTTTTSVTVTTAIITTGRSITIDWFSDAACMTTATSIYSHKSILRKIPGSKCVEVEYFRPGEAGSGFVYTQIDSSGNLNMYKEPDCSGTAIYTYDPQLLVEIRCPPPKCIGDADMPGMYKKISGTGFDPDTDLSVTCGAAANR